MHYISAACALAYTDIPRLHVAAYAGVQSQVTIRRWSVRGFDNGFEAFEACAVQGL